MNSLKISQMWQLLPSQSHYSGTFHIFDNDSINFSFIVENDVEFSLIT